MNVTASRGDQGGRVAAREHHQRVRDPVAAAVGVMTLLLLTSRDHAQDPRGTHDERFAVVAMAVLVPIGRILGPANALFVGLSERLARLEAITDDDEPIVEG